MQCSRDVSIWQTYVTLLYSHTYINIVVRGVCMPESFSNSVPVASDILFLNVAHLMVMLLKLRLVA